VTAGNVVAWTGYAAMRAEVAAADPRGAAMTWYMVAVAAIEAAGTATAALLPAGRRARGPGVRRVLVGVIACYGGVLLPTWLVAAGARVPRALRPAGRRMRSTAFRSRPLTGLLAPGGLVMLLGSGPTLLAVGLAAELHGTRWVAGSALAFALGSLLAPLAVARLEPRAVHPSIAWPALGVGMAAGWAFALASAAALRAFGSAAAVALAPGSSPRPASAGSAPPSPPAWRPSP